MTGEAHYLAGLDLAGRRVVVVGGGTVAQRRLPRLVSSGARIELVSPAVTPSVQTMADSGAIVWHRRPYAAGDLAGAWYVLCCTSSPEVNAEVSAEAERERVFCVRADAGSAGSAVTPATGNYDGLLVGVLAGGAHRRSAAVRDGVLAALQAGVVRDAVARPVGVALVGRRARRPGPDHRARPAAAGPGGRRRRRPAGAGLAAGGAGALGRGDRRGEDPLRAGREPGRDQRDC